jgi:hypothetical protein
VVVAVAFPEFMKRRVIELELTKEGLESWIKRNVYADAKVVVEGGKIYIMIPLDLIAKYRIEGEKVIIEMPIG